MKSFILTMLFVATPFVVGCGGNDTPPPQCTGTSCTCPAQTSCAIGDSTCSASSCTLACVDMNDCTGSCGESCSVSCKGGSTCDVTVGASGSMSCDGGAMCTLHCTGSCSLSCVAGSTCNLQCAGDSAPHAVTQGGSCG
ncbi:MAG TPA: hypothetical protein VLB44_08620 [Kofleriaceae bacterium]|nr:hypothetical protein [Kofleriaceae bacterium]